MPKCESCPQEISEGQERCTRHMGWDELHPNEPDGSPCQCFSCREFERRDKEWEAKHGG